MGKNFKEPNPILDMREKDALDNLKKRYDKIVEPGKIVQIGTKVNELIPNNIKEIGNNINVGITESELYMNMMKVIGEGFNKLEECVAQFSINEKGILDKVNKVSQYAIDNIDEICLLRSYDIDKLVSNYNNKMIGVTFVEGAGTGAAGFYGLPFNIVLSHFLYFRVIQSIAMFYGYDVKNNSEELMIAGEVFTSSLNPSKINANNEMANILGKFMLMSKADIVKCTAKKTWTDMAARGGIPLLLAQMRALAHKSAQKALQNAGAKGLENIIFKEAFEQIGKKLTLKTISKAVPVVSAVMGASIDVAQMRSIMNYANIFYQKRFIAEKENRIYCLLDKKDDIIDVDFN